MAELNEGDNLETVLVALSCLQLAVILGIVFFLLKNSGRNKDTLKNFTALQDVLFRTAQDLKDEMRGNRMENKTESKAGREELVQHLNRFNEAVVRRIHENQASQLAQLDSFAKRLDRLTRVNEEKFEGLRISVEIKLKELQQDNRQKLEEMRKTVDEKLNDTLEKRLGESFRIVSERLEQVHKGLGEMQSLASGVGDLKRVLSNVKVRGIWGEIQLGNLLEQILMQEQYAKNVADRKSVV